MVKSYTIQKYQIKRTAHQEMLPVENHEVHEAVDLLGVRCQSSSLEQIIEVISNDRQHVYEGRSRHCLLRIPVQSLAQRS